ncbi:MAG: aminoacyl-tRNA hydrolase [bacterium]
MKVIIGLGNPDKNYQLTRHNFGFIVLDYLANLEGIKFNKEPRFNAEVASLESEKEKFLLVKPLTYMNNSGLSAEKVKNYYKIDNEDFLLIYDDLDLTFNKIRLTGQSSAGHKGVESIIKSLGTNKLSRIRLGINNESKLKAENFVLQKFSLTEQKTLNQIAENAISEIHKWIEK